MRAIVTVVGRDRVGIIAGVSATLARHRINILDMSQTVLREDSFAMILLADLSEADLSFVEIERILTEEGARLGVSISIQREDLFDAMHQV